MAFQRDETLFRASQVANQISQQSDRLTAQQNQQIAGQIAGIGKTIGEIPERVERMKDLQQQRQLGALRAAQMQADLSVFAQKHQAYMALNQLKMNTLQARLFEAQVETEIKRKQAERNNIHAQNQDVMETAKVESIVLFDKDGRPYGYRRGPDGVKKVYLNMGDPNVMLKLDEIRQQHDFMQAKTEAYRGLAHRREAQGALPGGASPGSLTNQAISIAKAMVAGSPKEFIRDSKGEIVYGEDGNPKTRNTMTIEEAIGTVQKPGPAMKMAMELRGLDFKTMGIEQPGKGAAKAPLPAQQAPQDPLTDLITQHIANFRGMTSLFGGMDDQAIVAEIRRILSDPKDPHHKLFRTMFPQ